MNPREQFEKENPEETVIMRIGNRWRYNPKYVICLEKLVETLSSNPEPKKSKLQILMDDIRTWSDATFGDSQRTIPILYHLIKEVPELIESVEKEGTVRTTLFEFADCFMLLLDAASHHGYKADDILLAMSDKLEINKKRKWGNPDENGVIEHIRESLKPSKELTRDKLVETALAYINDYYDSETETLLTPKDIRFVAEIMVDFYLEMSKNN